MSAPPYPLEGVVSWNMNTTCNYRCTYCTQRFVDDRKAWARDGPRFIAAFARLPGDWEIKLSGGEPFRHPEFLAVVAALAAQGRRVSVVTNLSAPDAEIAEFVRLTAARPGIFSASLHLEYVDPHAFREKLTHVTHGHGGSICVTCVATRGNLPRLRDLKELFAPIAFKVQPEKHDRDVIDYAEGEIDLLTALGGHNNTGAIAPSYEGRACWAGSRYFVVDHRGEAFRCYPARRQRASPGERTAPGRLGNLLDANFALSFEPSPCRYTYCNCTVPRDRGMVRGEPDARR